MTSVAVLTFVVLPGVVSGASLRVGGTPDGSSLLQRRHLPARDHVLGQRRLADGYRHLGCFADDKEDRVMTMLLRAYDMTIDMCYEECASVDSAYFATQFGQECWCTQDAQEDYSRHGMGVCDMWCGGDGSTTCGGTNAFDVYALDAPVSSAAPGYLGCFADSQQDRVFGYMMSSDDMTSEVCLDHCLSVEPGVEYYATQFGNECWCGLSNSESDYDRHGTGDCMTPCAGDASASCGGHNAFDLYYVGEDPSSEGSDDETSDDPMMEIFNLHNAARCVHESDPLAYNSELAESAAAYSLIMASDAYCGMADIPDESGYDSNTHVCASSDAVSGCFSVTDVMSDFYDEQIGGGGPEAWGPKGVRVLWKDTTQMGCALSACVKDGMTYDILVCDYSPAVDIDNADVNELGHQMKTFQECGYYRK